MQQYVHRGWSMQHPRRNPYITPIKDLKKLKLIPQTNTWIHVYADNVLFSINFFFLWNFSQLIRLARKSKCHYIYGASCEELPAARTRTSGVDVTLAFLFFQKWFTRNLADFSYLLTLEFGRIYRCGDGVIWRTILDVIVGKITP